MIRILLYVAIVLVLGFGFSWLADRPGELFIIWQGQRIEMTLMVAATIVAGFILTIMIVWWLIRIVWTSPHSLRRYFRARKRDRGYQALSTGLIAVGAGDAPLARRMLDRAKGLISTESEPLIHLLEAQSCLIEGKTEAARRKFEKMAEDPETRELGLRGLYLEAQRLGAHEAARHYAEKAVEKAPHLPWAAQATLEYRTQGGRYDDAIRLLESQRVLAGMDKQEHDRKKAVLLAGRALSRLDGDPKGAREDAVHALKLSPELVPAAAIAARAYFRENNSRKALSVLEQAWKLLPHSEIATLYVSGDGAAAVERLRRAERLEAIHPKAYESLLAVGQAALDAREFDLARQKAETAARIEERESVYLLMADIEEAETGDQARVRHWLAQALRAGKDPEWVADGQTSQHWLPVSPVSGKLDAFEWKKAYSAPRLSLEGVSNAEEAFSALPEKSLEPVESATTIAETAVSESMADAKQPSGNVDTLASERKPKATGDIAAEPEPFFGGPPDDPGVKKTANGNERNAFRLF